MCLVQGPQRRGSNQRPLGLQSSTLPLSHCAPVTFSSVELTILCNLGRGHYEEHSCEIISNLDPVVKDEMLFKENVHAQRQITLAFGSGELKIM